MTDHHERWTRVAEAITARMQQLALSQADLCRLSGVSDITIRRLTRGSIEGRPRPAVLAKVAGALGWTTDSIDRILAGGDPQLVDQPAPDKLDQVLAELAELRTRIERLEAVAVNPGRPGRPGNVTEISGRQKAAQERRYRKGETGPPDGQDDT